jgi:hypothetical protein
VNGRRIAPAARGGTGRGALGLTVIQGRDYAAQTSTVCYHGFGLRLALLV